MAAALHPRMQHFFRTELATIAGSPGIFPCAIMVNFC